MSDKLQHECGIAFIRLRKPFAYYVEKYGSMAYAINRLFLLMEKQHNRGQDGAGVASIKLNVSYGKTYMDRLRSVEERPIHDIFAKIGSGFDAQLQNPEQTNIEALQTKIPFAGELLLGHLRYSTYGKNEMRFCHPVMRSSNWRSRNLLMAGNFNMTNAEELYQNLIELGQYPQERGDTITVLEKVGHFLDLANQHLYAKIKAENPDWNNQQIIPEIERQIDLHRVLKRACKDFDGGYAMVGLTGHGDAFIARDPAGIRPAYFYADEEVIVAASEKPAIKTTFNCNYEDIQEIQPATALAIKADGSYSIDYFTEPLPKRSCTFERIYFSRGTDPEIYTERKNLGRQLASRVLDAVKHDLANTIFSYIPNTAETAFLGMMKGIEHYLIEQRNDSYDHQSELGSQKLHEVLSFRPRVEKLVVKDTKMRTFITNDNSRDDLVTHVYDTTYEIVRKGIDTLVVIDDSIVRGTTLEKSILRMLDRLEPKAIVIVSSAPQIRFPDCYGIDMSKMEEFIAFRALILLLKERNLTHLLDKVYAECLASFGRKDPGEENYVKQLYAEFSDEEISDKIAEIISVNGIQAKVKVIYQTVDDLHKACPNHTGNWYFTGDYPTKGGNRVANRAFANYMEGKKERAY
ncbi:MAG: amidophosphoribosyltransferase [Bernardetiaceae bacterium]|nr:amidophosphoribosyltransferase [Bernardetiaceae bacterium]